MTREADELRAELVMCQSENAWLRGKVEVYEAAIAASLASGEMVRPIRADGTGHGYAHDGCSP